MQVSPIDIPPVGFLFSVEIEGQPPSNKAQFQEVSGIGQQLDTEVVPEGGENRFVHPLPKRVTHDLLVLKRGVIMAPSPFFDWCYEQLNAGLQQKIRTETLVVHLLDDQQQPVVSWVVEQAYPVKWTISDLKANQSELLVESISLAYHTCTQIKKAV
jgi:phage tail-like protein